MKGLVLSGLGNWESGRHEASRIAASCGHPALFRRHRCAGELAIPVILSDSDDLGTASVLETGEKDVPRDKPSLAELDILGASYGV